ncbi:MAG TPA: VOC family protein [Pyrinomonadaceae bacterium]|jgi:catechol 2,3-dioxygenase-like lactoylglutathione lyase family enzyme
MKTHLSINVRNVKTSVDFYRKMFGVEPVKVRAD